MGGTAANRGTEAGPARVIPECPLKSWGAYCEPGLECLDPQAPASSGATDAGAPQAEDDSNGDARTFCGPLAADTTYTFAVDAWLGESASFAIATGSAGTPCEMVEVAGVSIDLADGEPAWYEICFSVPSSVLAERLSVRASPASVTVEHLRASECAGPLPAVLLGTVPGVTCSL
jgi:hypothetical protein